MSSLLKSVDAQTLSRLSGLKLRARAVVEGVLSGLHKSPHQGQSVEFAEHKEYAPGDELRHLDWKALGKFDRYYVKRFEHETNLRAVMAIDGSPSMAYQSKALSKLEVARILAAALSYILVRQQDAVGITVFSGQTTFDVAPRANAAHLNVVLEALESINTRGDTQLKFAADHLAEKLPRRSLICVFSDFLDDDAQGLRRILALKARRHDLALFHILDPAELEFPFEDPTRFLSMEDDRQLEVNPAEIRDSYLQEFNQFLFETRQACMSADVDYERVRTDESLDQVLLRFLSKRAGR